MNLESNSNLGIIFLCHIFCGLYNEAKEFILVCHTALMGETNMNTAL
jgi:hypothetical protein